jgi:hypothetical protein
VTKKILVLGANSAMAQHAARLWAIRGDALYLVGRDAARLDVIADDLRTRGAAAVHVKAIDLCSFESHAALVAAAVAALGGIDVALVAHGLLLPRSQDLSAGVREMLDTNATSVISLVEHLAQHMETRGQGVLAVMGSVAGDRGRASNAVYGAAKAAVAAHASATRQRLARRGAWMVTIKPGFVDTPMTAALPKGPLWAAPEDVAKSIVRAIDRRTAVLYVPGFWAWIMRIIGWLPEPVFVRTRF